MIYAIIILILLLILWITISALAAIDGRTNKFTEMPINAIMKLDKFIEDFKSSKKVQ